MLDSLSFNSRGWREVAMRGYDQYTLYKGLKCSNNKNIIDKEKSIRIKSSSHATEFYIQKQLKWSILCCLIFHHNNKVNEYLSEHYMKEKSDNINAYNYLKHIEKVNNFAIVAAAVVWDRFLYNTNKPYNVRLRLTLNFELLITLLLRLTGQFRDVCHCPWAE